jgi:hypothetical protein
MEIGEAFLMGSPRGNSKHLWIVISNKNKHGGKAVIINVTTDQARCCGVCMLAAGDHPWLVEAQSWVSYRDAMLMDTSGWGRIYEGMRSGMIVSERKTPEPCLKKIIVGAKQSHAFPPRLLEYLD